MFLKKRKGSVVISAVLASIVLMFVAQGLATVYSSQFSTLDASRTALQTLQFAEVKASELRVTSYADIDDKAQARIAIPSTNFEREVVIGAEEDIGGGNKQKIATVNIYKPGEAQPRFALPVPLSSQGSSSGMPMPQTDDPTKPGYVFTHTRSTSFTLPSGGTWLVYRLYLRDVGGWVRFSASFFRILPGGTIIPYGFFPNDDFSLQDGSVNWDHGPAMTTWAMRLT